MNSSTIDPTEVDYYNRLADQWWDLQGKFWPLHRLNELRVEYIKQVICLHFDRSPDSDQPLAGITVVDIGCGGGILSESMAKLGAIVHGIDVVEKSIKVASQHSLLSQLSIDYELTDLANLADRGKVYDVVLNMEVVEHVSELPLFMSQCSRLVSDNGLMFIATLNRNFLSWLFAIVGAEYLLGWLPRGTHSWRKFVKPAELESLLAINNLAVRQITGVKVNPFNRQFSLNKRLFVNYMLSAVNSSPNRSCSAICC